MSKAKRLFTKSAIISFPIVIPTVLTAMDWQVSDVNLGMSLESVRDQMCLEEYRLPPESPSGFIAYQRCGATSRDYLRIVFDKKTEQVVIATREKMFGRVVALDELEHQLFERYGEADKSKTDLEFMRMYCFGDCVSEIHVGDNGSGVSAIIAKQGKSNDTSMRIEAMNVDALIARMDRLDEETAEVENDLETVNID